MLEEHKIVSGHEWPARLEDLTLTLRILSQVLYSNYLPLWLGCLEISHVPKGTEAT